jgi:hypothetical protein
MILPDDTDDLFGELDESALAAVQLARSLAEGDERLLDAAQRLEHALEAEAAARAEWRRCGRPTWVQHPNGTAGEHPTLRVLRACERHASAMAGAAGLGNAAATRRSRVVRPAKAVAPSDHPDAPPKLRYLGKFTPDEMKLGSGDMASKLRPILDDDDEPAPDSAAPPWGEK